MRTLAAAMAFSVGAVCTGHGQMPDGRLLWSMDSVYVLVAVDDATGSLSRLGLTNQVHRALGDGGLVVDAGARPGFVVRVTVRALPGPEGRSAGFQLLLRTALTDNVTRVKYVDAALTRCMSAVGCRQNVEGARALGSPAVLWEAEWLGFAAAAETVVQDVAHRLDDLVARFLTAHEAANYR